MRMLVVDDEEDNAELLALLLEREGWDVVCASTFEEAKRELAQGNYAALLTDVHLSDGNGLCLLDDGRPSGLRVAIVTTGSAAPMETEGTLEYFDAVMSKPIRTQELIEVLHRAVGSAPSEA